MLRININEIPGYMILKNFFNNISSFDNFLLQEIKIYGHGKELDQIDIKLIVTKPVEKQPKKWARKKYSHMGILLTCVNADHFYIHKSSKEQFSVDIQKNEKYFYLRIYDNDNDILIAESETLYFNEPFGINI